MPESLSNYDRLRQNYPQVGLPYIASRMTGEIETGARRTLRSPYQVFSGGKALPLTQYINERAASIGTDEEALRSFRTEVMALTSKAPLAFGVGYDPASSFVRGEMVYDIEAAKKYAALGKFDYGAQRTFYQAWAKEAVGRGWAFGGLTEKQAPSFFGLQHNLAAMLPYHAELSAVRKYTTLHNVNPLRGIGTARAVVGPVLKQAQLLEAERAAESLLRGVNPEYRARMLGSIQDGLMSAGSVQLMRYTNHPALLGSPMLYRRGSSLANYYAYGLRSMTIDLTKVAGLFSKPEEAQRVLGRLESGRGGLSGEDIIRLRAAGLESEPELEALLATGVTPLKAARRLGIKTSRQNRIFSVIPDEGGSWAVRLFYGQERRAFPDKVVAHERKALMAARSSAEFNAMLYSDLSGRGLTEAEADYMKKVNVISHVLEPGKPGSEMVRHLEPQFEGALLYLTNPQLAGSASKALSNAHLAADRLNQIIKANTANPMYKAMGYVSVRTQKGIPYLLAGEKFGITPELTAGIVGLLGEVMPFEHGMMTRLGVTPAVIRSLKRPNLYKMGQIIKFGPHEIMGAMSQGFNENVIQAFLGISGGPVGQEVRDVLGYLGGTASIPGANVIKMLDEEGILTKEGAHLLTARIKGGAVMQTGHPLFDYLTAQSTGAYNQTQILELPEAVKISLGKGMEREMTHVPLLSMAARRMKMSPSGIVESNYLNRSMFNMLQAVARGVPGEIQESVQAYMDAMGRRFTGKKGLIANEVFRGRVWGAQGTLGFLSEDAESLIAQQFGGGAAPEGIAAVTFDQYRVLTGMRDMTEQQILEDIKYGQYVPVARRPSAPRGIAIARLGIATPEVVSSMGYGPGTLYTSPGLGLYLHGDLDADPFVLISEYMRKPGAAFYNEMFKEQYGGLTQRYLQARTDAIQKLSGEVIPDHYARALNSARTGMAAEPTQEELAMALFQKKNMTGRAFNAYLTTTEGGRYLAAEGRPGFNSQYVEGLGSLFATIHEKGIDLKRGGARGILDIDLAQILSGNQITPTERENQLLKLGEATGAFDEYFADTTRAQKRQVVRDAISAFERAGSAGSSAHKRYLAVTGMQGSSLAEAITLMSGRMHRAPGGLIDQYMVAGHFTQSPMTEEVSKQLGSINANTARSAFVEGAQRLESGFKEYAAGLKEGKGWGALAIGAAVLAGVGLGMQKPGRMNVTMNQGDETEAPIISPRNERAIQLLSEQQHQARIMIQNAQKVDRSTFIQLGDAISGKYNVPGRTKIHLRDDRDQTDYSVIFRDEFRRQMAGIS